MKAATRNKLSYSEIRTALLSMYNEQAGGKGKLPHQRSIFYQEEHPKYQPEYDAAFYSEYAPTSEHEYQDEYDHDQARLIGMQPGMTKMLMLLMKNGQKTCLRMKPCSICLQEEMEEIQKQKIELDTMLAKTDRDCLEARKAVAMAEAGPGLSNNGSPVPQPCSLTSQRERHRRAPMARVAPKESRTMMVIGSTKVESQKVAMAAQERASRRASSNPMLEVLTTT